MKFQDTEQTVEGVNIKYSIDVRQEPQYYSSNNFTQNTIESSSLCTQLKAELTNIKQAEIKVIPYIEFQKKGILKFCFVVKDSSNIGNDFIIDTQVEVSILREDIKNEENDGKSVDCSELPRNQYNNQIGQGNISPKNLNFQEIEQGFQEISNSQSVNNYLKCHSIQSSSPTTFINSYPISKSEILIVENLHIDSRTQKTYNFRSKRDTLHQDNIIANNLQNSINNTDNHELEGEEVEEVEMSSQSCEEEITFKGNAVNMAKNILKGFVEYTLLTAPKNIIVECCGQQEVGVTAEILRKRFRKQYNSRILVKPSNSKLLKLLSNSNYGSLFQSYFESEQIIKYIDSSNIQNKEQHKDLVLKIRQTEFKPQLLQEVLKTRVYKKNVNIKQA